MTDDLGPCSAVSHDGNAGSVGVCRPKKPPRIISRLAQSAVATSVSFGKRKRILETGSLNLGDVDLAERIDGPVLEIGCGTGLVLLPIARAGITTQWRRQSSPPMLGILRVLVDRAMVSRMVVSSAFSDWMEFSVQPVGACS